MKILSLPSKSTITRYVGNCDPTSMQSLIKVRLSEEFKKVSEKEAFGSLQIDEMKIKPLANYLAFSDKIVGYTSMNGIEKETEDKLATKLLCFLFSGLSSHYKIPVGYFFTSSLNGKQLHELTLHVIKLIEETGFIVLHIVADNAKVNVSLFNHLCEKNIRPQIPHPLNPERVLFLSYDYCHVLKNLRNQFVSRKRILRNKGKIISSFPLQEINTMQKDWVIKLV